ncbi:MAG: DNA-directed RNA polymerase subunit K [Nanoarchaeota archaeon]|nr:DNA-directed RNA polymerase subunit K [Nanoarchaeota archaeon]
MIMKEQFTRYEIARIIGARALQIAMDAPFLVKISEEELKLFKYDPLKIAERELDLGALPISIHRPLPRKHKDKLMAIKEETVSDEEIKQKEKEVEKEIVEDAGELGFTEDEETFDIEQPSTSDEA